MSESVILDQPQLEESAKEWQKILGLNDWDIKPGIYRANQMETEGNEAECDWVLRKKTAIIRVLDPIDYPENILWPQDMEESLVHELIHLHIAPFDVSKSGSLEETAMEQAVDQLSRAFIRLKRHQDG